MKRRAALKALLALPFAPSILETGNSLKCESDHRVMACLYSDGDLWLDIADDQYYRYTGSEWRGLS